jgi:Ca2+-binding RTX toxin-like protein
MSHVQGFDFITLASGSNGNSMTLGNGNYTGTDGLIVVTDLGINNTIDGSAITGSSTRNLIVYGGASGDQLFGGGGSNFLVAGSAGSVMTAGAGATGFELTSAASRSTIKGFNISSDQIVFSDAGFDLGANEGQGAGLPGPTQLTASVFSSNTNGTFANAQNRFAYNASTGALLYSPDGKSADAVTVAVLTNHPHLNANNLYFFA